MLKFNIINKNKIFIGFCASLIIVFSTPSYAIDRARQAGFIPHKALYNIRLSAKSSSAKIANIRGKMFYEWQPSCDAWVSTNKFDMIYEYNEMPSMRVTSDFSTYESFDGKNFNFTSQRKRDGIIFEEVRGNVEKNDLSAPSNAIYKIPEDLVFELPSKTFFPMAHTLDVLKQLKEGKKFFKSTLFDGSDAQGPVDVNVFVIKKASYTPPKKYETDIDKDLVSGKAWKMRLAFFPLNISDSTSDYEMSLVFHENGVMSDMKIDYSDFSVTQKLIAIEPIDDLCHEGTDGKNQKNDKRLKNK